MIHWSPENNKDANYQVIICKLCFGKGERVHFFNGAQRTISCVVCNGWGHVKINVSMLNEVVQSRFIDNENEDEIEQEQIFNVGVQTVQLTEPL